MTYIPTLSFYVREAAHIEKRDVVTQIKCRSDWRVIASCWLLVLTSMLLLITHFAPTDYYRDIFFYADTFVTSRILVTGHIPVQPTADHFNSWGKIGTRIRLPVLPLLLSIFSSVTGMSINYFYIYFPSFLFIGIMFLLFFKRLSLPPFQAHLLAAAGGVAFPATVTYTMNVVGLGRGLVVFSCYLIYHTARNVFEREHRTVLLFQFPLLLCLITLFFWYPPHYAKVVLVSGFLIAGLIWYGRVQIGVLLLPIVASLLFLQIFTQPIIAYQHYLILAIEKIAKLSFASPTGGGTESFGTELPSSYYSLLPLLILLPIGLYGGYHVIRSVIQYLMSKNSGSVTVPPSFAIVAAAWGGCVLLLSVIYLATSTGFLVSRPYLFAIPVIFLGGAVGLQRISLSTPRLGTILCIGVVILVISSAGLQASSPGVSIHTYDPGQRAIQDWVTVYDPGLLYTDTVRGAPLASAGYFDAIYPRNKKQVVNVFYRNYSVFRTAVNKRDADAVLLSRRMVSEGIFAAQRPNIPMSHTQYQGRITNSSQVYSSGSHVILLPSNQS